MLYFELHVCITPPPTSVTSSHTLLHEIEYGSSTDKRLVRVSCYFAQIDAMRWTPRMEECLRAVGANKECPTDEAFVFQVRLQLIVQRAVQIREQQEVDHTYTATAATPLPTFLYLKTLQGQLQELRASLSPGLQHQGEQYRP